MIEGAPTMDQITSSAPVENPTVAEQETPTPPEQSLKGVETQADVQRSWKYGALTVADAPPPSVAIFQVHKVNRQLALSWFEDGSMLLEERMTPPEQPLLEAPHEEDEDEEEDEEEESRAEIIYDYLLDLRRDPALRVILERLQSFGDSRAQPCLIIYETTNSGIPWEMIPLPIKKGEATQQFLGARLATARWDDIQDRQTNQPVLISFGSAVCQGELLAYTVSDIPLPDVERKKLTERFDSLKQGARSFTKLSQLHEELLKQQQGVGCVYLFCHGIFAKQFMKSSLGSMKQKEERLVYKDLNRSPLRLLEASKSLVFLDACTAGRAGEGDPRLTPNIRYGFPQLFLRHGAGAVIGALDDVHPAYGGKVMMELIARTRKSPNTPIPELLRQVREDVAKPFAQALHDKRLLQDWYFTFVYVYYGWPMTTLKVEPKEVNP